MARSTSSPGAPAAGTCDWCHAHFHLRPDASRMQLASGNMLREPRGDFFILWLCVAGHGSITLDRHPIEVHGDEAVITPAGLVTRIHANTRRKLDIIRVPFDIVIRSRRVDNGIAATDLKTRTLKLSRLPTLALHSTMFSLNLGQRLLRVRHENFQDVDQLDAQIQLLRAIYMFRVQHLQYALPIEQMPVQRAYSYLLSHRSQADLKLQEVASHVGLSVSHLIRQFRDKYGTSPMRVLARERIAMAKKLLATPEFRIAEIALQCGFSSSAYFCRAFRAEMDMTPNEYRQRSLYQPLFIQK